MQVTISFSTIQLRYECMYYRDLLCNWLVNDRNLHQETNCGRDGNWRE